MQDEQAGYRYLSLAALSQLVRQKQVSPMEIVKGCLKRIEQLNPTLNAFIEVTAEQALKQAAEAEAEIKIRIEKLPPWFVVQPSIREDKKC